MFPDIKRYELTGVNCLLIPDGSYYAFTFFGFRKRKLVGCCRQPYTSRLALVTHSQNAFILHRSQRYDFSAYKVVCIVCLGGRQCCRLSRECPGRISILRRRRSCDHHRRAGTRAGSPGRRRGSPGIHGTMVSWDYGTGTSPSGFALTWVPARIR